MNFGIQVDPRAKPPWIPKNDPAVLDSRDTMKVKGVSLPLPEPRTYSTLTYDWEQTISY